MIQPSYAGSCAWVLMVYGIVVSWWSLGIRGQEQGLCPPAVSLVLYARLLYVPVSVVKRKSSDAGYCLS